MWLNVPYPCLWLTLPIASSLVACSGKDPDPSVDPSSVDSSSVDPAATASEAGTDAPDPLEGLRGLVSPAEFERFEENRGLVRNTPAATPGLTVIAPLNGTAIHMMDLDGSIAHSWETGVSPGGWCYLADDGTLYHGARQDENAHFRGGGIGGIIRRIAPDGEVLWQYDLADEERWHHHDLEVLPNGNVLLIAWERRSAEACVARGRDPRGVGSAGLWTDAVFEVRPTLPAGGEIVWSWHAWDHLIQDLDPSKPNHATAMERPERFDINTNFDPPEDVDLAELKAEEERRRNMAALGYGGGDDDEEPKKKDDEPRGKDWDRSGDWMHTNAIDYDANLDLIVLSSPEFGEIFVIDHSTTTEEARGSTGGARGRGGDILWRWGNPANYGRGSAADQRLFYQHDPQWLDVAVDAAPRLLVFNNGGRRPDGTSFSEVLELELPLDAERGFELAPTAAFGPAEPAWVYADAETFFSAFISGAYRMPSGNTLICSGVVGRVFEVTTDGDVVWDYFSTYGGEVEPPEHAGKAPPYALYRTARYARDHPGVVAVLGD